VHIAFRRLLAATLFLALTILCAPPAQAQEPAALTIVLSGNTYGNYEPCPS